MLERIYTELKQSMKIYKHTKRVASISAAFYNAGVSSAREVTYMKDDEVYINASVYMASITNIAFACETALKAQLPFLTRGHLLKDLFNKLDQSSQNELIDYVCLESKDRTVNPNAKYLNACKTRADFMTLLAEIDNIFADTRYLYEGNKATKNFPRWFLEDFGKVCLSCYGYEVDPETGFLHYTNGNDCMSLKV
jgi:hypothetical protein